MLIVQKFGGTSVADVEKIRRAAGRTAALVQEGHRVVTVVSAQGDWTDVLLGRAGELNPAPPLRELDALLATGEQLSAALFAMAVEAAGVPAVSLTGAQAGIHTDGVHGNARITRVDPAPVLALLDQRKAVIAAGFQGAGEDGSITTLGRGGSDTTAVALAAALHADRCRIYTDVDGVYDRDPRKYPDARRFDRIDYQTMLRMSRNGAQVLHDRCVELAMEKKIPLEVLSAFTDTPGTLVTQEL